MLKSLQAQIKRNEEEFIKFNKQQNERFESVRNERDELANQLATLQGKCSFHIMQQLAYENSVNHGWYDGVQVGDASLIPEKLCLIHSEVSEALEAYRDGKIFTKNSTTGKPEGFPSELADVVIRIMDLCGHLGIDLETEILQKHAFNVTRPLRHGGKVC